MGAKAGSATALGTMAPTRQQKIRETIYGLIIRAGWDICARKDANITIHRSVAIRVADYLRWIYSNKSAADIAAKKWRNPLRAT